jgi:hypothetical protein
MNMTPSIYERDKDSNGTEAHSFAQVGQPISVVDNKPLINQNELTISLTQELVSPLSLALTF